MSAAAAATAAVGWRRQISMPKFPSEWNRARCSNQFLIIAQTNAHTFLCFSLNSLQCVVSLSLSFALSRTPENNTKSKFICTEKATTTTAMGWIIVRCEDGTYTIHSLLFFSLSSSKCISFASVRPSFRLSACLFVHVCVRTWVCQLVHFMLNAACCFMFVCCLFSFPSDLFRLAVVVCVHARERSLDALHMDCVRVFPVRVVHMYWWQQPQRERETCQKCFALWYIIYVLSLPRDAFCPLTHTIAPTHQHTHCHCCCGCRCTFHAPTEKETTTFILKFYAQQIRFGHSHFLQQNYMCFHMHLKISLDCCIGYLLPHPSSFFNYFPRSDAMFCFPINLHTHTNFQPHYAIRIRFSFHRCLSVYSLQFHCIPTTLYLFGGRLIVVHK